MPSPWSPVPTRPVLPWAPEARVQPVFQWCHLAKARVLSLARTSGPSFVIRRIEGWLYLIGAGSRMYVSLIRPLSLDFRRLDHYITSIVIELGKMIEVAGVV
jgi:hypothetical protein